MSNPALTIPEIENKCLTSVKDFLIKVQSEPTIGQLSHHPKLFLFVGAVLIKINTMAGIKHNITDSDMADIKNLIFMYFKGFSLADIYKAFELERYGMYDEKTDHFQLFNSEYVSQVLKKYQKWKQNKKIELNITKESVPLLPELSDVQKKKIHYESLCATYERIKSDGYDDLARLIYPKIKNKIEQQYSPEELLNIYKEEENKYLKSLKQSSNKADYFKAKSFEKYDPKNKNYDTLVLLSYKNRIVIEFVKPHLATLETFLNAIGYKD